MPRVLILVMAALCAVAVGAPQGNQTPVSTLKTPVNMSYEELQYILLTKRGEEVKRPTILSPCARAILGCCAGSKMNSHCSEQLNCGAFFFDDNPCEEKFVTDALKAAKSFYSQFGSNST